jgi:NAD-dependent dihydropyrimidine dehydrogenase PreA subunit
MSVRKIVNIDEDKCNGCGLCVPSCAEGAIKVINGKAKLRADNLCDGLGACLGECPQGAITITERDADEFDEAAVEKHFEAEAKAAPQHAGHGCPGSRVMEINRSAEPKSSGCACSSQLTQWPVQLMLVPVKAAYFDNADILVTADCVPFAYANYHIDLLKGKKVLVGCPKLDDNDFYLEKLTEIFSQNRIKSVTVAFMEVPCCGGIVRAVEEALRRSGKNLPLEKIRITINGEAQRF